MRHRQLPATFCLILAAWFLSSGTLPSVTPAKGQIPAAQSGPKETDRRFEEIRARFERGEPITPEERQYVQSVMERRNQEEAAKRFQEWAKVHPPRESTDLVPLADLGRGSCQGEQGGLYLAGRDAPPQSHLETGLRAAAHVAPLDGQGRRSSSGKIVLLTVGVSNTTMESQAFLRLARADKDISPDVVIVDGAQGGQAADQAANPQSNYWKVVDQRLETAGVTPKQVQVLWIKETYPLKPPTVFPAEAQKLKGLLVEILHTSQDRFPNLKIAYLSSRIYAGYSLRGANPEPFACETGFSVKWAVSDQISGKPELNCDPAKGQVRSPWIAWGPYLWADGVKGRQDGLVWLREDLADDGMHPSRQGCDKVAKLLLDFLKRDQTSRVWFLAE
jgi:hypothetical protein